MSVGSVQREEEQVAARSKVHGYACVLPGIDRAHTADGFCGRRKRRPMREPPERILGRAPRQQLENLEVLRMWVATDNPERVHSARQGDSLHSNVTAREGDDTIYHRSHT